jgi:putative ABC transport system permease protein
VFLKIAFRNAKTHWRQSLSAILSVSTAYVCFTLFQGYMKDVEQLSYDIYSNRQMLGHLIFESKTTAQDDSLMAFWTNLLSAADQGAIQEILEKYAGDVESHTRFLNFQGVLNNGLASKIFIGRAFDVENGRKMRANWEWDTLYGKPLHLSDSESSVLLGQTLADQMGCAPAQKVYSLKPDGGYEPAEREFQCQRFDMQASVSTESGNLNAADFDVSGLIDGGYREIDSRIISMPLPLGQMLLNTDKISYWSVKLRDGVSSKKWIEKVNADLTSKNPKLRAIDWQDHKIGETYRKTLSFFKILRNFIVVVIISISIISILNTMYKIVTERTREIGSMLSLGFQRRQVLKMFIYESAFLTAIGVSVGVVASLAAKLLLDRLDIRYRAALVSEPLQLKVAASVNIYLFTAIGFILIGLLTTYLTCRSTVNKKIVECLHDL